MSSQHLILVGMPASGKTTLGRELAAHLKLAFVDLDAAIEARAGHRIPAIFATRGEACFRDLEAETLREVLARAAAPLVLATGGGTPCFHDNMALLNAHGLTIWLDVPVATLARRLHSANNQDEKPNRPLLAAAGSDPESWLRATLTYRSEFYRLAGLRCAGAGCLVAALLARLRAAGYGPASA